MTAGPARAELAPAGLERSELCCKKLIDAADEVFFVVDRTGVLLYRSAGGRRLTGWDEEEVRGRALTTIVLPESLAAARAAIAETLSHPGRVVRTELRVRHRDGSVIDVEVQGRNLLDDPDVGGILVSAHDVTARKRAEAALLESRQILEAILDALPVRVFWKDRDLIYRGCNAIFARDAGFEDSTAVVGKDDYQMGWRAQADLYRADDLEVIASDKPRLLIEEPQTTPDGGAMTLLTSKVPLRGPAGEISGVLGTYFDISERKRSEAALVASEVRYRRLFEAAKDGILILDAETSEIRDVNPFLCDLLGYPYEQMVGRKLWEIGAFRDVPESKGNFRELQQREYIRYDDLPLRTAAGREISVEFVSNVYRVDGQAVIQCNIRDMTERKRGAEEHARLVGALSQATDAILMTDLQGAIVYVNPAFERVTGWTSREVLGLNPRILKSGSQDDAFYRQMWDVLSRGEAWTGRIVNRRKDGTLFEEETSITPVRDASGAIVSYVAVKRDISSERRLEEKLRQVQKMEAVGRLAGGVAHDFNNLLGVIAGYGELVHQQLPEQSPLREEMAEILKAAERAADLTRQLLAFGRKQVLRPVVLDLNAVVADLERMLRRLIGEDVALTTRLAADSASVRADPGQLEQVLMNLVVNARDAMPEGGQLTIETRNVDLDADAAARLPPIRPGAYVMLAVTDSGSGMDVATQARVFEPFFTTKAPGSGTGLGLSTVHGIVDQSGGSVCVESEVGVGTSFKVYLPRVEEPAEHAPEKRALAKLQGDETLLLVEDDRALRALLQRVLEGHGYTLLVAPDGEEALRLLAANDDPIDLMVTDVILPGVTGPGVAERVALTRPAMKVLFLSGYSDEAVIRQGLVGPGRAFLSKPFGLDTLLRAVREQLDAR